MRDADTTISQLKEAVRAFIRERAWVPYHTPRNLALSMAVELGELLEHFQWRDDKESVRYLQEDAHRQAVGEELADLACYLLSFSIATGIDLSEAIAKKLEKNARKYPAQEWRGRAH
jgi:dCTP diphosphatase